MSKNQEKFAASHEFIIFLNRFTELVELQLEAIRHLIGATVDEVMVGVNELSNEVESKAKSASAALEETYLNPNLETRELVENIQSSVDTLLEEAAADTAHVPEHAPSENRLRRFGGRFSKYMEAISMIEKEVAKVLFDMMAALSNDDVIRQNLEHCLHSVRALQVSLAYLLVDFQSRVTAEEVGVLKRDLLSYTFKLYTSEREKQIFYDIFGQPPAESADSRLK